MESFISSPSSSSSSDLRKSSPGDVEGKLTYRKPIREEEEKKRFIGSSSLLYNNNNRITKMRLLLTRIVGEAMATLLFINSTKDNQKPFWRGKVHLILVYLAPIWSYIMYSFCNSWKSYIAVTISVLSSLLNFLASALHHNGKWSYQTSLWMTKLDYVGIFIMIGGSCAPVPILLMNSFSCTLFLLVEWVAAIVGIFTILFGEYSTTKGSLRAVVYIVIGLSNVIFLPQLFDVLSSIEFCYLLAMAASYVFGGACYGLKKPNLWPRWFGYHELFHACCFAAATFTFLLNISVLDRTKHMQ